MPSLCPCHPWCSRAGPHPGKLRHQGWFPQVLPARLCWEFAPAVESFPLYSTGMFVVGRNVLGEQCQGSDLPLHPPPKSLILCQCLTSQQLSGVARDSKSHPWPLGSRIPQWEPARIHFLSVSALPGVTGGDARGVVTPGTPGAPGGAEPSWLEQRIQQDGWARRGEGAGQGPSPPAWVPPQPNPNPIMG